jgi:hypothetical protein
MVANVTAFCLSFVLVSGAVIAFDASEGSVAPRQNAQQSHRWCPPRNSQTSIYEKQEGPGKLKVDAV